LNWSSFPDANGHAEELVVCAPRLPGIIVLLGFGLVRTGEVRPMMPVEEILELHSDMDQQRKDQRRRQQRGKVQEGGTSSCRPARSRR